MIYDVLLTKKDEKFVASVCQWPEITAEGDTEERTLDMVRSGLRNLLLGGRLVQLDISPAPREHAWAEYAGIFSDDPDWEEFQESIRQYRRSLGNSNILFLKEFLVLKISISTLYYHNILW